MSEKPIDIGKLSGDFVDAASLWIKDHPRTVFFLAVAFVLGLAVGRCR